MAILVRVKRLGAVFLILLTSGCASAGAGQASPAPVEPAAVFTPPPPMTVRYDISGSATSASLTMQTPTGSSQLEVDVPLKNKAGQKGLRFTGFNPGDFLYLSAQNQGDYGTVTCRISVDGTVVSENTASGAYTIATCQGQA